MKKFLTAVFVFCIFTAMAQARQQALINAQNGKPLFLLNIADTGELISEDTGTSDFDMPQSYIDMLKLGLEYWSVLLGHSPTNEKPVVIAMGAMFGDDINASAASAYGAHGNGRTELAAAVYNNFTDVYNREPIDSYAVIIIQEIIGAQDPEFIGHMLILPNNGWQDGLSATMIHEPGHAFGIFSNNVKIGNTTKFKAYDIAETLLSKYDSYLADANGDSAAVGKTIVKTNTLNPSAGEFQLVNTAVGNNKYGIAFFRGPKTLSVLGSYIYDDIPDANPNNIAGMPINGFEGNVLELSHLELRNSMMSHQNYRNWNIFMEAEIALLEDIGLIIDRKNFYGHSIYSGASNIIVSDNFYARNSSGTAYINGKFNHTPLTIGLHIYGSTNTVIMNGEVLTDGYASAGIRIDGWKNELTINSNITANGQYGTGIMTAYGKNHRIIHRGTITANGLDGIGARFDFGDNFLGNNFEYRGSYIRTISDAAENLLYELDGALVLSFDITGKLSGKAASIYISPNAFVEKINIMNGASLKGDIISDWDADYSLIQHTGYRLVSTITFGLAADVNGKALAPETADPDFSLTYIGNITATNASMDARIYGGTLTYNGAMSGLGLFYVDTQAVLSIIRELNPTVILAQKIIFNSVNPIYVKIAEDFFAYNNENGYAVLDFNGAYSGNEPPVLVNIQSETLSIGFYDYKGIQASGGFLNSGADGARVVFYIDNYSAIELQEERTGGAASAGNLFISLQNPASNFIFNRQAQTSGGKIGIWVKPSYNYSKQSGKKDWTINNPSAALGFDYKIQDDKYIGISFAFDSPNFSSKLADIGADIFRGVIYGSLSAKNIDFAAYLGAGINNYSQSRSIYLERYDTKYSGSQYEAGIEIAKGFPVSKKSQIKPFLDYSLIYLNIEDYKEDGGIYALKFKDNSSLSHQIKLGARAEHNFTPKFDMGLGIFYKTILGDAASPAKVSFVGDISTSPETINHKWQEAQTNNIGLSLDLKYAFNAAISIFANIASEFATDYSTHRVAIGASYKF
ncbi:MAG: autotransporter outer membrane beta-barrel domain-containing protein [Elusimicrobiota bacterium]|jgi:hypothetical protein|nr:autotransporter outer membrane beta-barrel domain-containing protein [Elusimicrobiota bacterium]